MWDILITVGNLIIIPALIATALDKRAYIPRLSSGMSLVGLVAVVAGMVGTGLVFSPIVVSAIGGFWVFIFLFRHKPAVVGPIQVPELPLAAHAELSDEPAAP